MSTELERLRERIDAIERTVNEFTGSALGEDDDHGPVNLNDETMDSIPPQQRPSTSDVAGGLEWTDDLAVAMGYVVENEAHPDRVSGGMRQVRRLVESRLAEKDREIARLRAQLKEEAAWRLNDPTPYELRIGQMGDEIRRLTKDLDAANRIRTAIKGEGA